MKAFFTLALPIICGLGTLLPRAQDAELLPPPQMEIAGLYEFTVEHEGEVTTGIVSLRPAKGGAYSVRWVTDAGVIHGIALREDGYLWCSWRDPQSFGLCRYRIEAEGPRLVGDRGTKEVWSFLRGLK